MALFINGVGQDTFSMNGVSIDNLYVDSVLVWSSDTEVATIPRYELTEALVDPSTVDDSANTLATYNGLLTESDGTTPYEPTALQYPRNGLLELDNGRIMDTQYVRQQLDGQYGIYDADGSTAYKIWALQWTIGSNYVVWEGDQDTPLYSTGGHDLIIPEGTMKITEGRPSWLPSLETPLPDVAYDVTDQAAMTPFGETALVADGVTDDSAALNLIASNTSITNWYFPTGKTALLQHINVPAHIEAIYGSGTIISKAYDSGGNTFGAFTLISGMVIDGLSFFAEDSVNWTDYSYHGHITFYGSNTITDLQIRNCSFDMEHVNFNGIKAYEEDAVISGLRIYNNTFTNIQEFGIEMGNFEFRVPDGSLRNFIDTKIYDNEFIGPAGTGISFVNIRNGVGLTGVKDGTESYIYNNTLTDLQLGMEVAGTSGIYVHNNLGTGLTSGSFEAYVGDLGVEAGISFFYNNHMECVVGATEGVENGILLGGNSGDQFYDNYFSGYVDIDARLIVDGDWSFSFHDNTFVYDIGTSSSIRAIFGQNDVTGGSFIDNELYTSLNVRDGFYLHTATNNMTLTNNNVYMVKADGVCVNDIGTNNTVTGTTCELSYLEEFPTSRPGAGLLP